MSIYLLKSHSNIRHLWLQHDKICRNPKGVYRLQGIRDSSQIVRNFHCLTSRIKRSIQLHISREGLEARFYYITTIAAVLKD